MSYTDVDKYKVGSFLSTTCSGIHVQPDSKDVVYNTLYTLKKTFVNDWRKYP
jgi:hypothetical protein